jgi:hypothetical protein
VVEPRPDLNRPDRLEEPRGSDVLDATRWIPFVTFWQVSADLALGFSTEPGHGHNLTGEYVDGWAAVLQPEGVDAGAVRAVSGPRSVGCLQQAVRGVVRRLTRRILAHRVNPAGTTTRCHQDHDGDGTAAFRGLHPLTSIAIVAQTPSWRVVTYRQLGYRPAPEHPGLTDRARSSLA